MGAIGEPKRVVDIPIPEEVPHSDPTGVPAEPVREDAPPSRQPVTVP